MVVLLNISASAFMRHVVRIVFILHSLISVSVILPPIATTLILPRFVQLVQESVDGLNAWRQARRPKRWRPALPVMETLKSASDRGAMEG